jgi:hypothetical protein
MTDKHLQQLREQTDPYLMFIEVFDSINMPAKQREQILAIHHSIIEAEVAKQGASEKPQCVCKDCGKQVDKQLLASIPHKDGYMVYVYDDGSIEVDKEEVT